MIYYTIKGAKTNVRQWVFPGGEVGIDINIGSESPKYDVSQVIITARIKNSDDVMGLVLSHDAIKRQYPFADLVLYLPYIPYGRQDRVCNNGESHSLKVFGKLINSMCFKSVNTVDPHSIGSVSCIDNLYYKDQFEVFKSIKTSFREWYIVAPDQGATKKCEDFAKKIGAMGVITCDKARDLTTGKITGFRVLDEVPEGANLLVLDDLCDKGGTFIAVAKALTDKCKIGRLELAVTHGLFTHEQGAKPLLALFDKVYSTTSYKLEKEEGVVYVDL